MRKVIKFLSTVDWLLLVVFLAYLLIYNWYNNGLLSLITGVFCLVAIAGIIVKAIYFSFRGAA